MDVDAIMPESQRKYDAEVTQERALAYASFPQQQHQWQPEPQRRQWGWNWLEHWMSQPWQGGLMAPLEDSSIDTQESTESEIPVGRHSADYPNRNRKNYMDQPEGLARHSAEFPNRYLFAYPDQHVPDGTINHERQTMMVPSYMAATQSAKAKVRTHGPIKKQNQSSGQQTHSPRWASRHGDPLSLGGGTTIHQTPRSPSLNSFCTHPHWIKDHGPDFGGAARRTPPRCNSRRRIDFG